MNGFSDKMADRFLGLALNIIRIERQVCKTGSGRHLYGQLFRAGASAGANFEESRAAESRADFVHKMQIVLKELRESYFWIRLITAADLAGKENETLKFLLTESNELVGIMVKAINTAKSKLSKPPPIK